MGRGKIGGVAAIILNRADESIEREQVKQTREHLVALHHADHGLGQQRMHRPQQCRAPGKRFGHDAATMATTANAWNRGMRRVMLRGSVIGRVCSLKGMQNE